MCEKSIKNFQPFVKNMKNVRSLQGGGDFLTHTVDAHLLCRLAHTGNTILRITVRSCEAALSRKWRAMLVHLLRIAVC